MRASTVALVGLTWLGLFQAASAAVIPAKAVVAQVLLERAFDDSLANHRPTKPWPWADMAPIAKVSIPRLGFEAVVLDKGSGQAMAFGPSLVPGTAEPGESGTSVIAAHRDTHFRALKDIRAGDLIEVEDLHGKTTRYRVATMSVTRWDRFAVSSDRSQARLALVTCFPFGGQTRGPLRYIVHAVKMS
jgi:sortase A